MSILQAMYTGVSGIIAQSEALGVVGDNIANSNTVGYKNERALFQDMLGHSVTASNGATPGAGVKMGSVQQVFTQGSLATTGQSTDLALSGDGFFVMNGAIGGISGTYYTRNGQFKLDNDGYLVNSDGMKVQGYSANTDGTMSTSLASLSVPSSAIQPKATTKASIVANLDANAQTPINSWDAASPSTTSNFSTTISVFDSLGNAHAIDVYFVKTASNTWDWHALTDGGGLASGTKGQFSEIGSGQLTFDDGGALTDAGTTTITADFASATPGQTVTFNLGSGTSSGGTGLDGLTQFASTSNVASQSQDGYASGGISGISVDAQGLVQGIYTNGQRLPIGQVAVATFRSNQGLARAGQNQWIETRESGAAAIGVPGSGGRGAISAGSVEQSNVDIAQQFVDLISFQRAFSANSKTITTADEMLQELVNIKR